MRSDWRVRTVSVAGHEFYQVYRLHDVCADDTEKNRVTWGGYWPTRAEAENLARRRNEEEKR